jgi:hypothetical protein
MWTLNPHMRHISPHRIPEQDWLSDWLSRPLIGWSDMGGRLGIRPCLQPYCVRALEGTRTPNLLIRSQMLYPLSYERRTISLEP